MERPLDPYSLVVEEVRRRLRSGRFVQGEQLRVSDLADDLRLSGSPVREALSRLAGEGLIEDRRGAGFFAWRLDAVDLAELYGLQAALFWAAVETEAWRGQSVTAPQPVQASPGVETALEAVENGLLGLIRRARSLVLIEAHLRLADRLAPARRMEPQVVAELAGEWLDLAAILVDASPGPARSWIRGYRRRREDNAAALIAAMRAAPDGRRRI